MNPLFSRRHYAELAAIIAAMPDRTQRALTALHFSEQLAGTNPGFDGERFMRAAMGNSPAESVEDGFGRRWRTIRGQQ